MSTTNKFFTKKFYLDSLIDRHTNIGGDHFVGTEFKSFWVSKTNNSNFDAQLVINPKGSSSKIPLRLNQCLGFQNEKADDGCLEVSLAQPGVWIEITFSQDEIIQVGSVAISLGSSQVTEYEGSRLSHTKKTVTSAVAELIPSDDNRLVARLQFKSASATASVYVGNPAELADGDYQNICTEVKAGEGYVHRGSGALSARTVSGSNIYSLFQGFKS